MSSALSQLEILNHLERFNDVVADLLYGRPIALEKLKEAIGNDVQLLQMITQLPSCSTLHHNNIIQFKQIGPLNNLILGVISQLIGYGADIIFQSKSLNAAALLMYYTNTEKLLLQELDRFKEDTLQHSVLQHTFILDGYELNLCDIALQLKLNKIVKKLTELRLAPTAFSLKPNLYGMRTKYIDYAERNKIKIKAITAMTFSFLPALQVNDEQAMQALIDHGLDINATHRLMDNKSMISYLVCDKIEWDNPDIADQDFMNSMIFLINHGANPNVYTQEGVPIFQRLCRRCCYPPYLELMKQLIEHPNFSTRQRDQATGINNLNCAMKWKDSFLTLEMQRKLQDIDNRIESTNTQRREARKLSKLKATLFKHRRSRQLQDSCEVDPDPFAIVEDPTALSQQYSRAVIQSFMKPQNTNFFCTHFVDKQKRSVSPSPDVSMSIPEGVFSFVVTLN